MLTQVVLCSHTTMQPLHAVHNTLVYVSTVLANSYSKTLSSRGIWFKQVWTFVRHNLNGNNNVALWPNSDAI